MDQWYAVYNLADGTLFSTGTVLADPMPDGLASVTLSGAPDFSQAQWNPATLEMEAIT